jgi:hypothetical protein
MINPQKGIDLFNNLIISRIFFTVTIFQHSPLTRRVFYNTTSSGEREGTNINSIWNTNWHIYKSSEVFLIINNIIIRSMELENHHRHRSQHGDGIASLSLFTAWSWNSIIIHSMELEWHHHHYSLHQHQLV